VTALGSLATWPQRWGVPHVSAAVVTAGGVVDTFGEPDRPYPIASVTKLLTAYALLTALEEEALSLDDPAGPPGSTLEHLLAHTAGYSFESNGPVIARPGHKRIYSNRGIEEAADHLARATGIDFGTYFGEAVLEPLGLAATELAGSPATAGRSTVTDLSAFVRELLDPRRLAPQTVAGAVSVHFDGLAGILPGLGRFDPCDWGLGFERNFGRPGHWTGTSLSRSAFGHFGASGTFVWVDPEAGVGCVCLTDLDFEEWAKVSWPELAADVVREHSRRAA
jgi:CubicO group peptidase (beta-lactamase class C family)